MTLACTKQGDRRPRVQKLFYLDLRFRALEFRRSHSDNPGEACGSESDESDE